MLQEGLVLVAVMIIIEVLKQVLPETNKRLLPVIALLLGVLAQVTYSGFTIDNVFAGILVGGAAAGVYDFVNKTILDK